MGVSGPLAGDEALDRRAGNRQGQPAADHRVNADNSAVSIDEWATGVSGPEGNVGLEPISGLRTFERSCLTGRDDDTGGCGAAKPGRVADSDGYLSRSHGTGIPKPGSRQIIGGDLDHRKIAIGVARGHDTGELAPVVENDVYPIIPDDVPVRDHDAIRAPDNSSAVASALADENDRWFDLRGNVGNGLGERQPRKCRRYWSLSFKSHGHFDRVPSTRPGAGVRRL